MLLKQRKGWIAAVVLISFLSASAPAFAEGPARGEGSWIARLLGWLGLPPSVTAVWGLSSIHIDPDGQPKPNGTGTPAGTDDSIHIDPDG